LVVYCQSVAHYSVMKKTLAHKMLGLTYYYATLRLCPSLRL
jgi:hypothetical protein